jgi:hypothetical protein
VYVSWSVTAIGHVVLNGGKGTKGLRARVAHHSRQRKERLQGIVKQLGKNPLSFQVMITAKVNTYINILWRF